MLNIAIDDSNTFYRKGMESFLREFFLNEKNKTLNFEKLTRFNINDADIIVQSFSAGEEYSCHPKLKYRRKSGLLIGLYEKDRGKLIHPLPTCIQNIVFINRTDSLNECREKINSAWDERPTFSKGKKSKKCHQCKYLKLTPRQILIAKQMLHGQDISKIALSMGINVKTVSAHKRLMMDKFNLHSDFELMLFFDSLRSHSAPLHLFS